MQFKCCRVAKRNFNVHHLNGKTFELNNPDVLGVNSNQEPGPPHQLSLSFVFAQQMEHMLTTLASGPSL